MEYKALKDIATITMGQSPESSSYNSIKDGLPFFQGNADFGEKYPNEKVWCNNPKKLAEPGDILISVRAPIGAVNYAKNRCCIGRGLAAISIEDEIERNFVFHLLKARNSELNQQGTGSTFKAIGKSVLENLQVPQIAPIELKKCINMMGLLEAAIRKRKKQLELLDELVKARFVEMFGEPIANTRSLETKALKDVLVLKAGDFTAASDIVDEPNEVNKYPCYGGNGIRGYVAEYNQEGEYSLVGRQGALSGNVQFAKGRFKNTEHALLVTPLTEMNTIWLNQLLINLDLKRYQTGAAQPGLSVKNLQEIPIVVVPLKEQNSFASFVAQVDKSKVAVQKALDETQLLFDSLMQDYFG